MSELFIVRLKPNQGKIQANMEEKQILERLTGKNHVQHVEFLEALAHCQGSCLGAHNDVKN